LNRYKFGVRDIVVVGLMAALTFVFTMFFRIDIPTPLGKTMLHLGNVMCLLSGLLFGPVRGGLAGGIGSMMYDLFDPLFISESWITFINKFLMSFVAGKIYHSKKEKEPSKARLFVAAIVGGLTYVVLYTAKQIIFKYFIAGEAWGAVISSLAIKVPTSVINNTIAAVASALLNIGLRPALKKAHLYDRMNIS